MGAVLPAAQSSVVGQRATRQVMTEISIKLGDVMFSSPTPFLAQWRPQKGRHNWHRLRMTNR